MQKAIALQKLGDETPSSKDTALLKGVLGTERLPQQPQGPLHCSARWEKPDPFPNAASHLLHWAGSVWAGGSGGPRYQGAATYIRDAFSRGVYAGANLNELSCRLSSLLKMLLSMLFLDLQCQPRAQNALKA